MQSKQNCVHPLHCIEFCSHPHEFTPQLAKHIIQGGAQSVIQDRGYMLIWLHQD